MIINKKSDSYCLIVELTFSKFPSATAPSDRILFPLKSKCITEEFVLRDVANLMQPVQI